MSKQVHALRRTSPKGKGQPFIGVCIKCGQEDIPLDRMHEECPNVIDLTDAEVFHAVIQP